MFIVIPSLEENTNGDNELPWKIALLILTSPKIDSPEHNSTF